MNYTIAPGVQHLLDEQGNVAGVKDMADGEERLMVFDGRPANSLMLDTTPDTTQPLKVGEFRWNATDGTADLKISDEVTLQIGQEQNKLFRNNDSVDIANGLAVYITGSTGTHPTVKRAQADGEDTSAVIIGVATQDIVKNQNGYVTTFGLVRDINTSALTEGAPVWLSPSVPGGLTSTKPTPPQHLVLVGYCIRSHNSLGSIFVKPQNGYELEELHNVLITNPQNGQVLKYNSSLGLWVNSNP